MVSSWILLSFMISLQFTMRHRSLNTKENSELHEKYLLQLLNIILLDRFIVLQTANLAPDKLFV